MEAENKFRQLHSATMLGALNTRYVGLGQS